MNASYYAMKRRLGDSKRNTHHMLTFRWYPVPGCNPHCAVIGTRRGEILFRRYVDLPQKSHTLYWRSHPDEYTNMCSLQKL